MLTRNLAQILKNLGLTQTEAADKLGITQGTLSLYLSGKRQIRVSFLDHFCRVFGVNPSQCLGGIPTQGVPVLGVVQDGLFQKDWQQDDGPNLDLPIGLTYSFYKTFALEVRGDSMNKVYPDGSYVICIPLKDYHKPLTSGAKVVCQRQVPDNLVEVTLKEYHETPTGIYLIPSSTNPTFHPVDLSKEMDKINICAVVIGYYKEENCWCS